MAYKLPAEDPGWGEHPSAYDMAGEWMQSHGGNASPSKSHRDIAGYDDAGSLFSDDDVPTVDDDVSGNDDFGQDDTDAADD